MAEPFGDQDQSPGGANKRPAQTIEGTATELSVEPAPTRSAAPAGAPGRGREDRPHLAGGTAEGGEAEAPPPPRTSLPELKGFVTHLAAGLLGGLVGVVALALAWGGLATSDESGAPDIAALEQRLAKLEAAPPAVRRHRCDCRSSSRGSQPSRRAAKKHRRS